MKELYIDFDGVILDTMTVLYDLLEKEGIDPEDYSEEVENKKIEFINKLDWEKLISNTNQINDSIKCIKKIINSKKYFVTILTHVLSVKESIAKINYIRDNLKNITIIPVPKKISKTKMVYTKNAILIDDYSENLIEWEKEGGIGIKFSPKLKGKGFRVIDKLDKILDLEI